MRMNAETLKIALSKIAPLEQWNVSWSKAGPRVCWKLFRPNPQQLERLWPIISSFEGHNRWHLVDNCLEVGNGVLAAPGTYTAPPLAEPTDGMQVNEAEAARDLEILASEIEKRLDLHRAKPVPFSDALLTKKGLQKTHGPFEDFVDGGQRIAYLIVEPGGREVFEPAKKDLMLHFEPSYDEMPAISGDIVGADLSKRPGGSLTEQEAEKIEREFPLFWKISEYHEDAYLSPQDAERLARECAALAQIVSSPRALRGLDKMARIANWAVTKHYGVLFSAP
jgi:hypothetical protein